MPFAGGISLIAIGAILAFALTGSVRGIDLGVVGLILILAGAAAILIPILLSRRRPGGLRTVRTLEEEEQPYTEELPRYDPTPQDERRLPRPPRRWIRPRRD
ncbi:hypothetical protein GCM10027589_30770 [Actinocorallia lasiicapitis]